MVLRAIVDRTDSKITYPTVNRVTHIFLSGDNSTESYQEYDRVTSLSDVSSSLLVSESIAYIADRMPDIVVRYFCMLDDIKTVVMMVELGDYMLISQQPVR